jgi:hypothetical protein
MPQTLTVQDRTIGGGTDCQFSLDCSSEHITVRELIKSRIFQEVQDYNAEQKLNPASVFKGLVQPTDTEKSTNGYKLTKPRQISWDQQFDLAIKAFDNNQIIILVNDKQAESLDEQIEVHTDTLVTFLRLTQLVGG